MATNEFAIINHYFEKHKMATKRPDVFLGIGDDCALLKPPTKQLLAVSTDSLLAGVHFPADTSPHAIGYKSLAVSLSDMAAMGAEPAWVLLSLTMPDLDEAWLSEFSAGLFQLAHQYNLQLVGGDTSRGPLSITIQVIGFTPPGLALTRSGAKLGDDIYVSGNLGDAGLALQMHNNKTSLSLSDQEQIQQHLDYPTARVNLGIALRNIASAAIDISDGLAADLAHILKQSNLGATIYVDQIPLSSALQTIEKNTAWQLALSAGDDYELCFTAPPAKATQIKEIATQTGCSLHKIGSIIAEPVLNILDINGAKFILEHKGYMHF